MDLPRFAYRALREGEEPAQGLRPSEAGAAITPDEHVRGVAKQSQFVSLTVFPEVALYYARCRAALSQRIVRVDLQRLRGSRLVDLRTEQGCDGAGLGPDARALTAGDGELLYAASIPPAVVSRPHPLMARCEALAVDWGNPAPRRPSLVAKRTFLARLPSDTERQLRLWEEEPWAEGPQYPWGWAPPGERRRMPIKGRERRVTLNSKETGFTFGSRTWRVVGQWLSELEWPPANAPGGERGISFEELAIDYEVSTGHELPPGYATIARAGYGVTERPEGGNITVARPLASHEFVVTAQRLATGDLDPGAPWEEGWVGERTAWEKTAAARRPASQVFRPLRERALMLADVMRRMSTILECDVVPVPDAKWMIRGNMSLYPLDGSGNGHAGLPRRPILRGGAATEAALRELARTARTRRESEVRLQQLQQQHGSKRTEGDRKLLAKQPWQMWYADFEPIYDGEQRAARAREVLARLPALPEPTRGDSNAQRAAVAKLAEAQAQENGEQPDWMRHKIAMGHKPSGRRHDGKISNAPCGIIVCTNRGCK
eukprot:gene14828-63532_t